MKVAWSTQARRTISQLHGKNVVFSKGETAERKKKLIRIIEDKVLTHGAGSRKAVEGEWTGSYVVIADGYWVFYSYPPAEPNIVFIEAVVHSRQMTIRPI
ncbi:hypothetical protein [Alicyclobacillus fastidiosus]|uniref:hypothetical protein n=1 Tax=Alicyclobacillus fastidiosus TaxID=392011 RepID=UPI0023E9C4E5|nr:hypothetical protein [Alicyclobacillus fastidiosus]GMA66091.1 hypothetical protein GCM10025859_65330 [Alicyclobacillus fastidiosus]